MGAIIEAVILLLYNILRYRFILIGQYKFDHVFTPDVASLRGVS